MSNGEVLNLYITVPKENGKYKDFTTVYNTKIPLKDKKKLALCFLSLKKYGVDFEEILQLMKREEVEEVMFHNEN